MIETSATRRQDRPAERERCADAQREGDRPQTEGSDDIRRLSSIGRTRSSHASRCGGLSSVGMRGREYILIL